MAKTFLYYVKEMNEKGWKLNHCHQGMDLKFYINFMSINQPPRGSYIYTGMGIGSTPLKAVVRSIKDRETKKVMGEQKSKKKRVRKKLPRGTLI